MPVNYEKRSCGYSLKMNMYKAVRSFVRFLALKQALPMKRWETLKDARPSKRSFPAKKTVLTKDKAEALIAANMQWRINRPIITRYLMDTAFHLMIYAGLRAVEVSRLRLQDVDLPNNRLLLFGKGNKYRTVGIMEPLKESLQVWLAHYRPKNEREELLISRDGKPVTYNAMRIAISRLRAKLGFDITLHGLRRTAATVWTSEMNMPIPYAQRLLGHADQATTSGYILPDETAAIEFMNNHNAESGKPKDDNDNLLMQLLSQNH